MAAMQAGEEGQTLSSVFSLTGYLEMQERKERKGLTGFRKAKHYWFWFDEKDCSLKYYRNQDSYIKQYLLSPLGKLDLHNAKVVASAVVDGNLGHANTFIITTSTGQTFSMTAANEQDAHKWIKKLQEKRGQFYKHETERPASKVPVPRGATLASQYQLDASAGGLVSSERLDSDASSYRCQSQVRMIIHRQFRETKSAYFEREPAELNAEDGSSQQTTASLPPFSPEQDCPGLETMQNPAGSPQDRTLESLISPNRESSRAFTNNERQLLELSKALGEVRQERDSLHKQVVHLRDQVERQDAENHELREELMQLKETIHKLNSPNIDFKRENDNLKNIIDQLRRSLQSLDGEIELHKLQHKEREKQIRIERDRCSELDRELLWIKSKYVTLLAHSFKIYPPSVSGLVVEEPDPQQDKLKMKLMELVHNASSEDNPVFASPTLDSFTDEYGDLHDLANDTNIHHFLCRKLFLHFTEHEQADVVSEWDRYLKSLKKVKDRFWELPNDRSHKREFRDLLRKGIPSEFRTQVWSSIIHRQIGKMREAKNQAARAEKGQSYYNTLLGVSAFEKQIKLDIFRTLPSNKHFKQNGSGGEKLYRILTAYCNHNKNIGYCQGMNMICAIGLLYLDEETTFWFMVTVIEKMMPQNYYSMGLAAAQADQIVVKEILKDKLRRLYNHLETNFADVTVVTFNWFLTLFIDALPTESTLRIMDCFLWEGRKVFFRVSLAILKLHQRTILDLVDPVTIFQFIKEVAKHIFNVDELFEAAFKELQPFPSRSNIASRCSQLTLTFVNEWKEREQQKKLVKPKLFEPVLQKSASVASAIPRRRTMQWECVAQCSPEEVWLCSFERQIGKICIMTASVKEGFEISCPPVTLKSRTLVVRHLPISKVMMFGMLDFTLYAMDCSSRKEEWALKMNDSILDIVGTDHNTVVCSMANGYIAVLNTDGSYQPHTDPTLYCVGSTAVNCLVLTPSDHLWCSCGKAIIVLSAKTFDPIRSLVLPDSAGKVYKMVLGAHGIWVTFRSSSVICLFDAEHMVQLLEVDYTTLLPAELASSSRMEHRITSVCPLDKQLWVGTGTASVHIFSVSSRVADPEDSIMQLAQHSEEDPMSKSLCAYVHPSRQEGLVGGETTEREGSPAPSPTLNFDRSITDNRPRQLPYRFHRRNAFGRTFHREIRREHSSEARKEQEVYQLNHITSSKVMLAEPSDSPRVIGICPIRSTGRQFVVTCVNSSSCSEKAMKLWQCSGSDPSHWSFSSYNRCYDTVTSNMAVPTTTPVLERSRAYSTVLGSQPSTPRFSVGEEHPQSDPPQTIYEL